MLLGLTPDGFVPRDNPLRRIKPLVDSALRRMSPVFDEVYAAGGRPSIPPEHLLKASLLMAFYTIRSERQFCEQLRYNILFKWFLDLNVEDEPFHPTTFTENRERLLEADRCSSQGQASTGHRSSISSTLCPLPRAGRFGQQRTDLDMRTGLRRRGDQRRARRDG